MFGNVQTFFDHVQHMLNGRRFIVIYKKGGRIADQHIYDSSIYDLQNQLGIFHVVVKVGGGRVPDRAIDLLGKSYIGFAPWEKAPPPPILEADVLRVTTPLRVATVNEREDGTILLTIES